MRAGIEMLKTTIVTGVPAAEYSDWNAVKLLYGDIFNDVLKNKAVPGDDYLADVYKRQLHHPAPVPSSKEAVS